jgi:hypothetical protein
MGWTVWYQLVRAEPPTADELTALAAAAAAANAEPWDVEPFRLTVRSAPSGDGVVVDGASKIAMSLDESDDGRRMVAAINAAVDALPGAVLRLHDDFGAFGVAGGRCSLDGDEPEAPIVIEAGELVAIDTLVKTRMALPASLAGALAALAAGTFAADRAKPTVIAQALAALGALDRDDPRRGHVASLLDAIPLRQRAQVGLDRYGELGHHQTREYLGAIVDELDDVTPLVPAFLAAWQQPTGIHHYGDMPWRSATRDRFARAPEVIARMTADLADAETADTDSELPWRRAEHAAQYLARSGAPDAVAALIALLRRWRGRDGHWRLHAHVLDASRTALGTIPHPQAVATLLLELAGRRPFGNPRDALLRGLARIAPQRALPVLRQACAARSGMPSVVEALAAAGTAQARALLDELRDYPHRATRDTITRLDRQDGRPATDPPAMPAAESLLAHPDREVRQDALEALIQRGDRSLYLTLLHAEALHRQLQLRLENSSVGPGWRIWEERDLVPAAVLRLPIDRQLAWAAGEGAASLGPQLALEAMEGVRQLGVAAVVASYPEQRVVLSADETAALLAEEEANLRALADS